MTTNRKRHLKVNSRCFKLHRSYSISFNFANIGEIFSGWIRKDRIQVWKKKKTTFVLCSPHMKRACEIRNFHVTGLQRRQRNEQNSVMHVKFVVLSIKTYYFSAILLPSPLSLVLLSSRNSATKNVHGDVTSLFSFLLCYPLSVQCVLHWSYLCDLAS